VDFNKHQNGERTILKKRHMNKVDNTKYKRGVKQRYGIPQEKKNQTEILEIKSPISQTKNTVEGHSRRLEQVEDRISDSKIN
jgi:hypothetical protein